MAEYRRVLAVLTATFVLLASGALVAAAAGLVVTDGAGGGGAAESVAAQANTAPDAAFGFIPTHPNVGESVTFDASGSSDPDGSIASYQWDFGDGTTASGENVSHAYTAGGSYTVTLTVTDDDGATNSTTRTIDVNAAPTADFAYSPSTPEEGDTVTFGGGVSTDPDGSIVSYEWDFGDGETASGEFAARTYISGGSYDVTLTVTDDDGATDSVTQTVVVKAMPTAEFTYSPAQPTTSDMVTFDASTSDDADGSITEYRWDFNDDGVDEEVSADPTVSLTYPTGGTYPVELTVVDDDDFTDTATDTVDVVQPPEANFAYSPTEPTEGDPVTFDATDSDDLDGSIVSYEWDFDDGSTTTGQITSHAYSSGGSYGVTLTVTDDDGETDSVTRTIDVNSLPDADFSYSPAEPTVDEAVTFDASSAADPDGSITEYQWDFDDDGNSEVVSSSATATHTYDSEGAYPVALTVVDDDGLTDEYTETVDVSVPLEEQWNVDTGSRIQYATAAVGSENVYVGGLDSTLYAIDRTTGNVDWQFDRAGSLSDSSPALDGGTVYVGSGGGSIYAIDAASGSPQWNTTTESAVVSSPAVDGSSVYVGLNNGSLLGLDRSTGDVQWRYDAGAPIYSTVNASGGTVFASLNNGTLVAVDDGTGTPLWSFDTDAETGYSSPIASDGTVYVAADEIYALDAGTGTVTWSTTYGGTAGSSPVLDSGTLYVGSDDGTLHALDTSDGTTAWTYDAGASIASRPAHEGSAVLATSTDGTVHLLAETGGPAVKTVDLGATTYASPAVEGDAVYVGTRDGHVYAFEHLG